MIAERFYVEWNTGCGWMTDASHCFWNESSVRACHSVRLEDEKLGKWPMRLVAKLIATGERRILAA